MAENEKGEEGTPSRGADWEVVSLTASAYAAAPGPQEFDPSDESKENENKIEQEPSATLFMSGHFVFPPNEHENLPIEPDISEIHSEQERDNVSHSVVDGDNGIDNSSKENLQTEYDNDLHAVEFFDKGTRISIHDMGFDEGKSSERLNLLGREHGMSSDSDSIARHSEAHKSGTEFETEETLDMNVDSSQDHTKPDKDEVDGSDLPCQAWWKRHAASLYCQAKEANAFWSVVVAAAVVGIIILGRRWQQDKWQLHQNKWRFLIHDERMSRVLRPIGRLVGGH